MPNRHSSKVHLNIYQKGLLQLFRGKKWGYGGRTTAKLKTSAEPGQSIFGLAAALNVFQSYTNLSHDRRIKYADYDAMDDSSPIVAGALSLYAAESTAEDYHTKKVIWVESPDKAIAKRLNAFLDMLTMEERAWGYARNLSKYGDCFLLNLFNQKDSGAAFLKTIKWLHPTRVERLEDLSLIGFKCDDLAGIVDPMNDEGIYRPWDFVHGRIMSYDTEDIYGRSMIEEIRKVWKMLQILETMVAIAHVQRAMDRHIFKIDTTGLSDEEAQQRVQLFKTMLRKKEFFDPSTGQFKSDFNPITLQEDLFWPTRQDDASGVDTLQGKDVPQSLVEDLNYFKGNMCAGMGIPKEYLEGTQSSGAFDSKAALALQDIHFARKIQRVQKSFKKMVRMLCEIYLFASNGGSVNRNFTIKMGSLSLVEDIMNEDRWLKRAQVMTELAPLADSMGWDKTVWSRFIAKDILKDIPTDDLRALLAGGGTTTASAGDDDEDGSDGPKSHPMLPPMKPDSIATKLFSSTDDVEDDVMSRLREAFGDAAELPTDIGLREAKAEFLKIKAKIVAHYPELRGLAEKLEVKDNQDRKGT